MNPAFVMLSTSWWKSVQAWIVLLSVLGLVAGLLLMAYCAYRERFEWYKRKDE